MSQTFYLTEINGVMYGGLDDVLSFPDREEAIDMIQDMLEDGFITESDDYYEAVTDWYEIGEGECGSDSFFPSEMLNDWFNKGGIKEIEKKVNSAGYDFQCIERRIIRISVNEIEIDY